MSDVPLEPTYAWIALCTTGDNPRLDHVLEVAAVLTGPDLVAIKSLALVVNPELGRHGAHWEDRLGPERKHRFSRSGLLREVSYGSSPAYIDEAFASLLVGGKFICAGYEPQMIYAFAREQMSGLASKLQHRFCDLSSMRVFIGDLVQREDLLADFGERPGRAMLAVQDALSEARIYASYLAAVPLGE